MEHHQGRMAEGILHGSAERQQDAREDRGGCQLHPGHCRELGCREDEEGGAVQLQDDGTHTPGTSGVMMIKMMMMFLMMIIRLGFNISQTK
jgi:hypothetical protein